MKRITTPITLEVPDDTDPDDVRREVHSIVYTYLHDEEAWRVI